jgi:hypothetical protein
VALGGGSLGALLLAPSAARADDTAYWMNAGPLFSFVDGNSDATAIGAEVCLAQTPSWPLVGVGPFVQAQAYFGDDPTHGRFAAGILAGTFIGLELGVAHRMAAGDYDATTGLHLAPYFTLGVFSVATRWTIAGDDDGKAHGSEFAVELALKYPWHVAGQDLSMPHGRRLRSPNGAALAATTGDGSWQGEPSPDLAALTPSERRLLAQAWLADARAEHASVAAFARLTLELMTLGAPPALLADLQRAALDEIEHAKLCFGLASRYAGAPLSPGALPEATQPWQPPTYERIACEAFEDGCLGEGLAVARARAALSLTSDRAVRRVLEAIVRDESRHQRLAWRILDFCLERGGAEVAATLGAVLERSRQTGFALAESRPSRAVEAHGQASGPALARRVLAMRKQAEKKLEQRLCSAQRPRQAA